MKFESYKEEKKYFEQQASLQEFLDWYKQQDHGTYELPSVTVDNLIFGWEREELKILFIKRKAHPFINQYAFPGGFHKKTENSDEAAIREASEETGLQLDPSHLRQFKTISTPNRDPRAWVITIAYFVFLPTMEKIAAKAGGDAKDAQWLSLSIKNGALALKKEGENIPLSDLAFDHRSILEDAVAYLRQDFSNHGILKVLGPDPKEADIQKLKEILAL